MMELRLELDTTKGVIMNTNTNTVTTATTNGANGNGKRQPAIDATDTIRADGSSELRLKFSNGAELVLDPAMLTEEIRTKAMLHGLKQKLVDAAAISRDPDTGREATIDTKFHAVAEVYERLVNKGEWNKNREGAVGAGGLLFKALCRRYPAKSAEQLRAWLDGKDDKAKAALRKNPEIAKIIEEIRAEKGDTGTGADLLAELEGDDE